MVETKKEPSIRRLTMTESAEHFSRRNFLKTVGSAAASLVTTSIDKTASSQSWNYPNVLVIFPDQWRRQAFGWATVIPLSEHLILIG